MAVLTEEQAMLQDMAKGWVQEKSPVSSLRRLRDGGEVRGFDDAAWREMAEMGWAGVVVPEEFGGSSFGWLSLGLVLEECGRTLTASPLLASAVAAGALVLGGSEALKVAWLPRLADGSAVGALAVDEGPRHAPERTALRAERDGDGWRLTGRKAMVLEGMAADLLIVAARTGGEPGETDGVELFAFPAGAGGITRERLVLADSRGAANMAFEAVQVGADKRLAGGWALVGKVLDRARAGMAAEMLGAAAQAFEMTVDYLKTRVQFGHVIGSFQALQHRAAAMLMNLELSRSAVEAALAAIDRDAPDAAELVSIAKAKMGETALEISRETVQMHGGIGMTDAHDAGFYLKRARAAENAFGNQAYHRDRYARLQGY